MPKSKIEIERPAPQDDADSTNEKPKNAVIACSWDEVEQHLRAFIDAFVLPQAQARWREFLIEKRSEWDTERRNPRNNKISGKALEVFEGFAVDKRFCTRVTNAQRLSRAPSYFDTLVGTAPAVYFDLYLPPCKMIAVEADDRFVKNNNGALLSFKAGKKVLFFNHDDGVWLCEKEPS